MLEIVDLLGVCFRIFCRLIAYKFNESDTHVCTATDAGDCCRLNLSMLPSCLYRLFIDRDQAVYHVTASGSCWTRTTRRREQVETNLQEQLSDHLHSRHERAAWRNSIGIDRNSIVKIWQSNCDWPWPLDWAKFRFVIILASPSKAEQWNEGLEWDAVG